MDKKVSEAVRDQIRAMYAEDRKMAPIVTFLKDQYNLTPPLSTLYSICKKKAKKVKVETQVEEEGSAAAITKDDPQKLAKEIKALIEELSDSYVNKLLAIRTDLIRARARLLEKAGE